jgi:hypothetical protein
MMRRLRALVQMIAASLSIIPLSLGGLSGAVTRVAAEPGVMMPSPKRVAPPNVAPVLVAGMRIEAIHWGRSRGLEQNGGYIAAIAPRSGRELWTLKVYTVSYDPKLEEDVQDVFIAKMTKASASRLLVVDEKGRRYVVDVKARSVTPRSVTPR